MPYQIKFDVDAPNSERNEISDGTRSLHMVFVPVICRQEPWILLLEEISSRCGVPQLWLDQRKIIMSTSKNHHIRVLLVQLNANLLRKMPILTHRRPILDKKNLMCGFWYEGTDKLSRIRRGFLCRDDMTISRSDIEPE